MDGIRNKIREQVCYKVHDFTNSIENDFNRLVDYNSGYFDMVNDMEKNIDAIIDRVEYSIYHGVYNYGVKE